MADTRGSSEISFRPIRRILVGALLVFLIGLFLLWRIDSPRAERFRAMLVDRVAPAFDWALVPVRQVSDMVGDFESYAQLYEQNQELRRELRQMRAWREAALQLEQENAKLLDLNNVRLDPALTYVTGVVLADSGSPFRQSILLNVGRRDGIQDGWATTDGLGLVGRIAGVGQNTSRVMLLTDPASRLPVIIQPSGQRGLLQGDNTILPPVEFIDDEEQVRPGDRVVSSGDGGVFPAGLLIGQLVAGADGTLRLRLSADYERLEFLRVLRSQPAEEIEETGDIVGAPPGVISDPAPLDADPEGRGDG